MDQGGLEEVQTEHGDLLVLAVGAGEIAVFAVAQHPVGAVPVLDDLEALVAGLPRRSLHGTFWHQGPTRYPLTSFADPAVTDGRYHQAVGPGVWYASDQEQAAWAELFRHFLDAGVDPFEVRRRTGKVDVANLEVLDLTDHGVRSELGVELVDLVGDEYTKTQQIARAAATVGFGGILAPSAALLPPQSCGDLHLVARPLLPSSDLGRANKVSRSYGHGGRR